MRQIIIFIFVLTVGCLWIVDLGLDVYIKTQTIKANQQPLEINDLKQFEIIEDL